MKRPKYIDFNLRTYTAITARVMLPVFIILFSPFLTSRLLGAREELSKTKAAAYVIDANTGQVLHDYLSTELRYPASLTKMMTLYLAFEAIKSNYLSLSSPLLVSEKAASVAPSKLGLNPGSEISLDNAIKALIVKSANDMAVAIAERISGTEFAFAQLMTKKAKEIGMKNTVFQNASGLPNKAQVTTARDIVTLGLRLQKDYSDLYKLFSLKSFSYNGKTFQTHNSLLSLFEGVDGIKTGYTRISGFNIVSSYNANGKKIVGAVFGGISASARDAHMRMLLAIAIEKASKENKIVRNWETKLNTPVSYDRNLLMAKEKKEYQKYRPTLIQEGKRTEKRESNANSLTNTINNQIKNSFKLTGQDQYSPQKEDMGGSKTHAVQIGIFRNIENAELALSSAQTKVLNLLKDHPSQILPLQKAGNMLYAARFSDFKNDMATKTCTELRRLKIDCLVIKNNQIQ